MPLTLTFNHFMLQPNSRGRGGFRLKIEKFGNLVSRRNNRRFMQHAG